MAVAWIGNRETLVEHAAERAAALLHSSRCPVITFDTDIHGTRAAIALAERVGAAYDHENSSTALAREAALFTDKGGMFIAPGEVRRRADVVVIVGALPEAHLDFVAALADTAPDLSPGNARAFFLIGDGSAPRSIAGRQVTRLACPGGVAATLATSRAQHAGRPVTSTASHFATFEVALGQARFPVFLFSGEACDPLALEMLQGLIGDINRKSRASALHLPASDSGWGGTLASTWSTGFPPRTGFGRGFPEHDPWRFDASRMIGSGEADVHLRVARNPGMRRADVDDVALIAIESATRPVADAEVTIAIGEAGIDHDGVLYSSRIGTLAAVRASAASDLPSAASILRAIAEHLPQADAPAC
ncbi:tungsten formylmethanofuran dehydrogenase [Arvimicrobium flavum]|uniref:tungsten formylmethanofuran dehydrogenase n=1 Tax=Arvimicrobium flavum TaxID=3393320 RepID=UPI00237A95C5|nr:tungsten formylmethanofuran dehydrogenase [Mesorhizobium shangrilense]